MRNLVTPVLIVVVSLCGVACGDDDSGSHPTTPLRDAGAISRVDGGMGPTGPGDEGAPCQKTQDCNGVFQCVANIFQVGICARHCATAANCDTGEVCFSYTDLAVDNHCVNIVKEEFGLCGVGYTSLCDAKRVCLYPEHSPIGVCVGLCDLDAAAVADAGLEDGGGSSSGPIGAGHVACGSKQTCVDHVLGAPDPNEGVCGMTVERGDACGTERGLFCPTSDICVPDDLQDANSEWRCHQDCSSGQKCEQGQCTMVQNFATYCM